MTAISMDQNQRMNLILSRNAISLLHNYRITLENTIKVITIKKHIWAARKVTITHKKQWNYNQIRRTLWNSHNSATKDIPMTKSTKSQNKFNTNHFSHCPFHLLIYTRMRLQIWGQAAISLINNNWCKKTRIK